MMRGRKQKGVRRLGTDEFVAKENKPSVSYVPITIYMHKVKQDVFDYYSKRLQSLYDLDICEHDSDVVFQNTPICQDNLDITSQNVLSKLLRNQNKRYMIICDEQINGQQFSKQDQAKVVNTFWLDKFLDKVEHDEHLDNKDYLLEEEELQKYSFELHKHVFYIAEGVKSKVKDIIWPNMGTCIHDFQQFVTSACQDQQGCEHIVLVPKISNSTQQSSKQFMSYFQNLFLQKQVTADIFDKLQFINEEYVINKVYKYTQQKLNKSIEEPMKGLYDSKATLKLKLQNNQNIFYSAQSNSDDQIDLSIDTKSIVNQEDKKMHVQHFEACDYSVLANACITVYDESLKYEATQLCNLMGAIVLDDIVPFMTTHIVALKHTPILKHQLSQLENQLQENMNRSGLHFAKRKQPGAIHRIGSLLNIKVVTIDWLKQCFQNEIMLNEESFVPVYTTTNGSVHQEQKKKRRNYKIKQNIFNGKTFAISEESFYNESLKEDDQHVIEVQEKIQHIEKIIVENSGRVIDQLSQSMFVIIEDGYDPQIWDHSNENETQIRIHPRFIFECQKHKALLDHGQALHLLPLPHRIPMPCFNNICVEFALVSDPIDALVFESLVKLFGIKKSWKDGKTTHLIVFATENLDKSVKLQQIKSGRFKSQIEVVDTNWLFDSMKMGRVLQENDFRVQY